MLSHRLLIFQLQPQQPLLVGWQSQQGYLEHNLDINQTNYTYILLQFQIPKCCIVFSKSISSMKIEKGFSSLKDITLITVFR
ncbi:hypothetical protein RchiOBHm_Chr2g0088881 [Rosa chinensis]|uniref:Uncharacterized protein n=1 Tax=Rosa chinensis TaxID=74649 RepID=A0A2P6RJ07_ROSCH|nr:hypothetical protein RchiOBHm_Chr2g0088881 [Rosa chinensis]